MPPSIVAATVKHASCSIFSDSLTVGSRLLLPHISTLLQYLSGVVRNTDRLKKKKFRAQVAKELNILSKLVLNLGDIRHHILPAQCFRSLSYKVLTALVDVSLCHRQGQSICERQGAELSAHQPVASLPPEKQQPSSKIENFIFDCFRFSMKQMSFQGFAFHLQSSREPESLTL